jgi:hypothetical protein
MFVTGNLFSLFLFKFDQILQIRIVSLFASVCSQGDVGDVRDVRGHNIRPPPGKNNKKLCNKNSVKHK